MESRLANLQLNESTHEEQLKDKQQEIEQECVSFFLNFQSGVYLPNNLNVQINNNFIYFIRTTI